MYILDLLNMSFVSVLSLSHVWLWDTMDYSLAGSSVHGFLLVRILEWVAVPFSRGSSQWQSGKIFNMLLRWNLNNGLCDINNQEFSNNNCDLIIRKIIMRIIIWQISSHKIKLISRLKTWIIVVTEMIISLKLSPWSHNKSTEYRKC